MSGILELDSLTQRINQMNMERKLVVITGASSGFGREMAKLFAEAGHPLLLLARRLEKMEALELPHTVCRKVDVTDRVGFEAAVLEAEAEFGPTDLLVNNAGVMMLGDIASQNPQEWKLMMDVNVLGVLNGMQIVMPGMKERKTGTIINVASIAGLQPFANHGAYCASKYGVVGLSQVARAELAAHNVRVLHICPGAVETELLGHTTDSNIIKGYNEWKESVGATNITALDVARTIQFAYELPQSVSLREIVIADTQQDA
ncbi:SDR family oxidoreductase [Pontibacter sp. G13]|uniref:SDR family oxidoreductase n=1 Tax=Pontibacter sp. G13 TaxID=3074898 RepID=UPI00288B05E4|nr:SDR family oxidoreductase [Pontibacter sp. G13]WNJ19491.1 SDR family oxidoreductase [Pontibacter sp. G13]